MKDSDDDRGLFRGSELPKLVLLAGLAITGWVMYVYFVGSAKPEPPKPPKTMAVDVPVLPPADPTPEIAGAIDDQKRQLRDDGAIAILLDRVRNYGDDLAKNARRDVSPGDLLTNPGRYRGLPIRLEGFARNVYVQDGEDTELTPKGRLYALWFQPAEHQQKRYLCSLLVEDVPRTLPAGEDMYEKIVFEGYFLKLLAYPAGDKGRRAPWLIGRITHIPNAAGEGAQRVPFSEWLWTHRVTIVAVAALVYIACRIGFRLLGSRNTRPVRSSWRPADTIDPLDLEHWVADEGSHPMAESDGDSPAEAP